MKSTDKKNIGKKLKWLRESFDYSQDELSTKLSLPRPAIAEIERGNRNISAFELLIICDVFGVDMRFFMLADIKGIKSMYAQKIDIDEYKHYLI